MDTSNMSIVHLTQLHGNQHRITIPFKIWNHSMLRKNSIRRFEDANVIISTVMHYCSFPAQKNKNNPRLQEFALPTCAYLFRESKHEINQRINIFELLNLLNLKSHSLNGCLDLQVKRNHFMDFTFFVSSVYLNKLVPFNHILINHLLL